MKIVIAPDSFKGSITAIEAAKAMERGVKRCFPQAETIKVPIADGGEGTMDSLVMSTGGRTIEVRVTGPLGEYVDAAYGLLQLQSGNVAVIEMAKASGLTLIATDKRSPLTATTYGTGELIKRALDDGCRSFILALGGSATNDGGAGMLQALGMHLLDDEGNEVAWGGEQLKHIQTIDDREWDSRIAESQFLIATDVQNPLLGPDGATYIYGPQKGVTPDMLESLEQNMIAWADLIEQKNGARLHELAGAGAAGGLCGAFLAFFPTTIKRGIDVVIQYTGIHAYLDGADLVITGEGQIDAQTANGKTPMGIAQEAQKYNVPTIALAGSVGQGINKLYDHGIKAVFSIMNGPMTLQQAMDNAAQLIESTTEQVMRSVYLRSEGR
ncbi:MAG: glycerate kinase [Paenibacillaceae bacterium]